MSSNASIHTLSNDSVSLSEIIKSMQSNENLYRFFRKQGIHKTYSKHISQFGLKLSNKDDVINSKILCYGFGDKIYTMDKIMEILSNVSKECLENVYYIVLDIKDDTRMIIESSRVYLAQKYAYFIEFLYKKCPNASRLWLTNRYNFPGNDDFLIYILEKLKTDKVIEIKPIFLEDILNYSTKYDFVNQNFLFGLPNLKIFTVEIFTDELPSYFSDCITPMEKLINCLCKKKNITLDMYVEGNNKSIYVASQILSYANLINFNVNIKQSSGWIEYFQNVNYTITNEFFKIINNLTTVSLFIHIMDDFKIIKSLFTLLENLRSISLHIDKDIIKSIYKQSNNMECCFSQIKKCFNYKSTIKNLAEFRLHLLCLSSDVNFSENDKLDILNNAFLEGIFSIIPNTLTTLYLISINGNKLNIFKHFSKQFPFLSTISFLLCVKIPENAIITIQSLRKVIIHGELKINIPKCVETVVFCYFDEDFCDGIDKKSKNKSNKYYFNLMNTTFNNSIRNINNDEIYYIAFLKDIFKWKDILYLADDYFY
ncbi:Hypothetical protein SRAE_2000446600 [Strongyloides ratti]|uniref:Uncharacterized protein n=1 Tax=Strongyloides ratti TaxID=34506 RepID=A0A090N000_STRRB|nr:Hypothetical protein SRAE_2000446600 [Strongyloides ratti]CEF69820.1 Hypothetical protein SRAE_2000446600 [Strongyloides ratti]